MVDWRHCTGSVSVGVLERCRTPCGAAETSDTDQRAEGKATHLNRCVIILAPLSTATMAVSNVASLQISVSAPALSSSRLACDPHPPMSDTHGHPSLRQLLDAIHHPFDVGSERDHFHPFLIQSFLAVHFLKRLDGSR